METATRREIIENLIHIDAQLNNIASDIFEIKAATIRLCAIMVLTNQQALQKAEFRFVHSMNTELLPPA